jgi:hypothetical protein
MSKLIKAELYRFIHTGNGLLYMILGTIIMAAIPVSNGIVNIDGDLASHMDETGAIIYFILMLFPPAIALVSGQLYNKGKAGFYEIMAGNKIHKIIFSKLLTDGVIFWLMIAVSGLGFYIWMGIRNGIGSLDMVWARLVLALIVMAQIAVCSVMITINSRKLGESIFICWARFMIIDSVIFPMLMWLAGTVLGFKILALNISYLSLMNKLMILTQEPVDAMIVLHVILGFIVEFVIWYALIYHGMKNRNFA